MSVKPVVIFRAICTEPTHIYLSVRGGFAALWRTEKNRIYDIKAAATFHGTPCLVLPAEPGDTPGMARVVVASHFRRIVPRKIDIGPLRDLLPPPKGEAA